MTLDMDGVDAAIAAIREGGSYEVMATAAIEAYLDALASRSSAIVEEPIVADESIDHHAYRVAHIPEPSRSPLPHTGRAGVSEVEAMRRDWSKFCADIGMEVDSHDAIAEKINAALTVEPEAPTHQHVKRGSTYTLIGYGKMQAERWTIVHELPSEPIETADMAPVAIYRSTEDGSLWVRPREEFEDGRFIELPAKVAP